MPLIWGFLDGNLFLNIHSLMELSSWINVVTLVRTMSTTFGMLIYGPQLFVDIWCMVIH